VIDSGKEDGEDIYFDDAANVIMQPL